MAKKKKKRSATAGKGAIDRHFFSIVLGLALGTGAFYAKRSIDTKSATA